ncbi:MAG: GTP 3',8-cyclase MoaA [Pseudomonadota bacterium]
MTEKIVTFIDQRQSKPPLRSVLEAPTGVLLDTLARPLHDLRISVTDRCNFRCVYCMPKQVFDKDYAFLPQTSLLSFEEITRLAKLFVAHGVQKIRLTGGEPLLRKNLEKLIAMLSAIKTVDGRDLDLTLTTNGALLAKKAQALKDAGLRRVTVSLDALDDTIFKCMNDVDFAVGQVLDGIDAAHRVGLGPVKINMVVKGGMNDQQIVPMARHFKGTPSILRFIEYMDVGASNGWKMDEVIPSAEVVRRIHAEMPLQAIGAQYSGETAARWQYVDGGGEVGMISSVTQAFCQDCSRARLSTEGKLYTCLFATHGHDLRGLLRDSKNDADAQISNLLADIWRARGDRYSALRTADTALVNVAGKKIEMSYIGG